MQCHQYTHLVSFCLHDPDVLTVDVEQVIISVILFTAIFANKIIICSRSVAHMLLVLSCLLNSSASTASSEQIIVPVICFLVICFPPCLLTRH